MSDDMTRKRLKTKSAATYTGLIPNCDEQDSSQFVVRSIATQAFLAVARARRRACQPAMSFTQCRLVLAREHWRAYVRAEAGHVT